MNDDPLHDAPVALAAFKKLSQAGFFDAVDKNAVFAAMWKLGELERSVAMAPPDRRLGTLQRILTEVPNLLKIGLQESPLAEIFREVALGYDISDDEAFQDALATAFTVRVEPYDDEVFNGQPRKTNGSVASGSRAASRPRRSRTSTSTPWRSSRSHRANGPCTIASRCTSQH